jgi:hypothetical protein
VLKEDVFEDEGDGGSENSSNGFLLISAPSQKPSRTPSRKPSQNFIPNFDWSREITNWSINYGTAKEIYRFSGRASEYRQASLPGH